jgi:tRNA threonylcarbamoyladenosine biosynthesis protein TsaB
LRIGVTAAKVFAYAVGAEVLAVSTFEAIAANAETVGLLECGDSSPLSVVIDAQRGEIVVQSFLRRCDGRFEAAAPEELVDADAWLEVVGSGQLAVGSGQRGERRGEREEKNSLNLQIPNPQSPIPNPSVVTGPGLARLINRLPTGVVALEERLWQPRAAVVGRLAVRYYTQGRRDDLWKLVPRYYRRSAAEEKWEARMAQR